MSAEQLSIHGWDSFLEGYQKDLVKKLGKEFLGEILAKQGIKASVEGIAKHPFSQEDINKPENEGRPVVLLRRNGFLRYGILHQSQIIELITSSFIPGAFEGQQTFWTNEVKSIDPDPKIISSFPITIDVPSFIDNIKSSYLKFNLEKYTSAKKGECPELTNIPETADLTKAVGLEDLSILALKYIDKLKSGTDNKNLPMDEYTQRLLETINNPYIALILDKHLKIMHHCVMKSGMIAPLAKIDLEIQAMRWFGNLRGYPRLAFPIKKV